MSRVIKQHEGNVVWVSKKPLLIDSVAQNITFASQFIQTKKNEGVLYTHVDDFFVKANTLYTDKLKNYI